MNSPELAVKAPWKADQAAKLFESFSEGMHTLIQPLTVLRATLEVASGNATSISHFQGAIDASLIELSRVSDIVTFLQNLIRIASHSEPAEVVDLASTVLGVRKELDCLLQAAHASFDSDLSGQAIPAWVSKTRLCQCLSYLLQFAARQCYPSGTICVSLVPVQGETHLVIRKWSGQQLRDEAWRRNHDLWGNAVPSLMLAEALMLAYGGRLEWQTDPFAACLSLPAIGQHEGAIEPTDRCPPSLNLAASSLTPTLIRASK